MFDFVGVAPLVVFAAIFYLLGSRASRVRNPFLKWLGMGPAILLAAIVATLTVAALTGFQRINFTGSRPPVMSGSVTSTPARLERGKHIAYIYGECHSEKLGGPLTGQDFSAQPPITGPVKSPPAGENAAYGKYLVDIGNCRDCHGQNLGGRNPKLPGPPAAPNLTAIIPAYPGPDAFIHTFRTGVNPGGKALKGMPWNSVGGFASDSDLRAMYIYLRGLKLAQN